MIKIYIPPVGKEKIGGGWSFLNNFIGGLPADAMIEPALEEADVVFLPASTMVTRDFVQEVRSYGKPIALRIDGVPEDWRNRGTGWSRTKDFAGWANLVIYQSYFVEKTIGRLLEHTLEKELNHTVIMNGADIEVFKLEGEVLHAFGNPSILYVNYRKGEHNKRVEEVIERFRYFKLDNPEATLTFVGNYSKQQFRWNDKSWDFGMLDLEEGKDWRYLGIVSDREELAKIMRSHEFIAFPSFADPCPNTLIEALCCGCVPLWVNGYGGASEIIAQWESCVFPGLDFSKERMALDYVKSFKEVL